MGQLSEKMELSENQQLQREELARVNLERFAEWRAKKEGVFWTQVPPQQKEFDRIVRFAVSDQIREDQEAILEIAALDFYKYIKSGGDHEVFLCSVPAVKQPVLRCLEKNVVKCLGRRWEQLVDKIGDGTSKSIGFLVRKELWDAVHKHNKGFVKKSLFSDALSSETLREVWIREPLSEFEQKVRKQLLEVYETSKNEREKKEAEAKLFTLPEKYRPKRPKPYRPKRRQNYQRHRAEAPSQEQIEAKQQEIREQVTQEVAAQDPEETVKAVASGPVAKLVDGLDTVASAIGEASCSALDSLVNPGPTEEKAE